MRWGLCYHDVMRRAPPLLLTTLLLLLPGRAYLHDTATEHEEWRGSIGALWLHYPLDCAVREDEEERVFQCTQEGNALDLTVRHSPSGPLLRARGTILGKAINAEATRKGEVLTVSGSYDGQAASLPLAIGGTAEDFSYSGTFDATPFQGRGSYQQDSLHVSLSFTKTIPITGTLDLRRSDGSASSTDPAMISPDAGTGTPPAGTEAPPAAGDSAMTLPSLPLFSSGTVEGATQNVIGRVQESGRAIAGFSRVLTLVFQTIFAVLVLALLIIFVFLLRKLRKQPPPGGGGL